MQTELKVLLYIKRSEKDSKGLSPLMGKITVKGEANSTSQLGCKIKIDPTIWNATSQRCCGKSRKAVKTNREIESLLLLIRQRFEELNSKLTKFTATDVKKLLQGVASEQETILGVFQAFNEQYQLRVGVNRAKGSYLQYLNTYRILSKFITFKYKVSDIAIKALDALFIENFAAYLTVEEKKQAKTVNGHLVRLKTIGRNIVNQGIVGVSPFKEYKVEKPERKLRHIHRHELEQIMATTFDEPNVMFTRDVFIFSCFTGISYCDMLTLTKQHIKRDDNGNLWIMINRKKTGVPENVLLLDVAVELIEKYSGADIKGRLFPMMKILTLNAHLKKIARACGIERNLTYHQSRHTFASVICISQGVPIESVSRAMGHKSIKSTQHYAQVTNEKISQDMDNFSRAIAGKFTLNGL